MTASSLTPLRFEPILKRLIWGGRRLGTYLHKPIGEAADYAESWEISDYQDDVSTVCEGPLTGTTLRELIRTRANDMFGTPLEGKDQFPLLVKFIDANQVLSVQVHPNDEQAKRLTNDNGKTEAWVVIHAEPGSLIYAGLKPGVARASFADAIENGTVEEVLHKLEARPGDCILIPAGTVHAIGAGVLLAEIQQMSNTTFRVFDWNRTGPDGKPRPLHIRESLEVTDFSRGPVEPWRPKTHPIEGGGTREQLATCPYFALERLTLIHPTTVGSPDRFTILIGLGGTAELRVSGVKVRLDFGQTLLLPAALGACSLEPSGSDKVIILTCVVP